MQGHLPNTQGLVDEINETGCDNCRGLVPRKLPLAIVKKQNQWLVLGLKMQEKDKPEGRPGGAAGADRRVTNLSLRTERVPGMTICVCHYLPTWMLTQVTIMSIIA